MRSHHSFVRSVTVAPLGILTTILCLAAASPVWAQVVVTKVYRTLDFPQLDNTPQKLHEWASDSRPSRV